MGGRARPGRCRAARDHAASPPLGAARASRARTDSSRSRGCCCRRSPRNCSGSSTPSCSPRVDADGPVQFRPTDDYRTSGADRDPHPGAAAARRPRDRTVRRGLQRTAADHRRRRPDARRRGAGRGCDRGHRLGPRRRLRRARRHRGRTARRLRGCGHAGAARRRQRPDPVARHRRAGLQPPSTPRDRPTRRRLHHPRMRRPRRAGAKSTMFSNTPTAARPTPTTASCSAGSTIGSSTATAGRSE